MHTGKETGERVAFRDWGFGAVAIGAALQDGPLGLGGAGQRAVVGLGALCDVCRDSRPALSLYSQVNAVYDDSYFRKSAELG